MGKVTFISNRKGRFFGVSVTTVAQLAEGITHNLESMFCSLKILPEDTGINVRSKMPFTPALPGWKRHDMAVAHWQERGQIDLRLRVMNGEVK